jgi:hypothetical protein
LVQYIFTPPIDPVLFLFKIPYFPVQWSGHH